MNTNDTKFWVWKSQIIDFNKLSKETIGKEGCMFPNPTKVEYVFRFLGIPDKETYNWRNGVYSCEYNEALSYAKELNLIEFIPEDEY